MVCPGTGELGDRRGALMTTGSIAQQRGIAYCIGQAYNMA